MDQALLQIYQLYGTGTRRCMVYVHYSVSRHIPLRPLINTITQYVITASPQL